jgi:hypothetical protein
MEDKKTICELLCLTLQATRNQDDLVSLDYIHEDNGDEIVQVKWKSGSGKRINVTMDSGTAMIRDIMHSID